MFGHRVGNKQVLLRETATTTSSTNVNLSNNSNNNNSRSLQYLPAVSSSHHHRQFGFRPANSLARKQSGKSSDQSVLKRWRNRRPPNRPSSSSLSRYLKIAALNILPILYNTLTHANTHIHERAAQKQYWWRWMEKLNRWFLCGGHAHWLPNLICCFLFFAWHFGTCYKWIKSKLNVINDASNSEKGTRNHLGLLLATVRNHRLRPVCHLLLQPSHPLQLSLMVHFPHPTHRPLIATPTPLICTRPAGTISVQDKMPHRSATTVQTAHP